jgi:hypothetical protein
MMREAAADRPLAESIDGGGCHGEYRAGCRLAWDSSSVRWRVP